MPAKIAKKQLAKQIEVIKKNKKSTAAFTDMKAAVVLVDGLCKIGYSSTFARLESQFIPQQVFGSLRRQQ